MLLEILITLKCLNLNNLKILINFTDEKHTLYILRLYVLQNLGTFWNQNKDFFSKKQTIFHVVYSVAQNGQLTFFTFFSLPYHQHSFESQINKATITSCILHKKANLDELWGCIINCIFSLYSTAYSHSDNKHFSSQRHIISGRHSIFAANRRKAKQVGSFNHSIYLSGKFEAEEEGEFWSPYVKFPVFLLETKLRESKNILVFRETNFCRRFTFNMTFHKY